ncbi:MAG: thioesterase family protein [Pirellulaceae bacterium]|nr:thioesterase family protein [Pirellulaceae bacterium]
MQNAFHFTRRVEFCDTDAAGIVHFSALMQYAEQCEHALFRNLGTSVLVNISSQSGPSQSGPSQSGKRRVMSWPRVRVECEFHRAARFEDELDVKLTVSRLGTKSIQYTFEISRDSEPICSGSTTSVCCEIDEQGRMSSIEIPSRLREQLQDYVVAAPGQS